MATMYRSRHGLAETISKNQAIASLDVITICAFMADVASRDPGSELPDGHVRAIVKAAYRALPRAAPQTPAAPGMPALNDTQLDLLIDGVLQAQPGGACIAEAMKAAGRQTDMTSWCIPRVKRCLACGDLLVIQRTAARPLFYAMFKPGCKGTVYRRHCPRCDTSYECDGYQKTSHLKVSDPASGLKLPYPPDLMHQHWIPVSSETVVSRDLVTFQLAAVHVLHGSSQATCTINTFMMLSEAQRASGGE